jgi:hypothetical protein
VLSFAGVLSVGGVGTVGRLGVGVGVSAGLGAQAKFGMRIIPKIITKYPISQIVDIVHLLNNVPYEKW